MQLYNSLTQKIEPFQTLEEKKVRLYVCGITPYDTTHLGHAFLYTFFDAFRRYIIYKGYSVNYVQNVTDIDDDILRKAKENALSSWRTSGASLPDKGEGLTRGSKLTDWQELGKFWTDKFLTDLKTLNIALPNHYVKATDSIPTMIKIIQNLLDTGFAYNKEGTIFFRTTKTPDYGKLSHFNQQQMRVLSKERGANPDDPRKENPLDFILWQKSQPDEPSWKAPFADGRPGWHLECSAMNYDYLGEQIDIHGGGRDLIYPHHESEIAQSESFTNKKPFSAYWIHAAMVMYQGEKMSKSLGNLIMVSDLLKTYSPNAIRWLLLSHHYRTPWEYTEQDLKQAEEKVKQISYVLKNHVIPSDEEVEESLSTQLLSQFQTAMDKDIDTTSALEILYNLAQKITEKPNTNLQNTLKTLYTTLGFTNH